MEERLEIVVLQGENRTRMNMEDYLLGVLLAEMPVSFEPEAHKAQAVVARTYALKQSVPNGKHDGGVCTNSACCQGYLSKEEFLKKGGKMENLDRVAAAVAATGDLVLTYDGKLIDATYFSCSGGRTEDALAVWGTDVPYLQAVDSPGEEGASVFQKERFFTKDEFARLLGRELQGSPQQWLGRVTYTDGAGVATMVVGGVTYTGKELRSLLCLNSTAFQMKATQDGITVSTKGYGHRVGMSQYGAEAMAVAGHTYSEILAHYYQGTVIDKYEDLG
jgi:stage II sporulation protein D